MHSSWLGKVVVLVVVVSGPARPAASAEPLQAGPPALSPEEVALACAPPADTAGPPGRALRLVAAQDAVRRTIFASGDLVVVNGGSKAGVQLGQEFLVRHVRGSMAGGSYGATAAPALHTAGWIRIVAVNDAMSIATVEHVCTEMTASDYLEPFRAPVVLPFDVNVTGGEPDFSSLGRVLSAGGDRTIAAAGDFVLIDRGGDQGVAPGLRFAIYRDVGPRGAPLTAIGEAIVVSAAKDRALARILRARDVVMAGDYLAPRK